MKVSIWHQFSSNHSGSFDIVGVFSSREAAQKAADEIRSIIKTIQDWHRNNPEKANALYERWSSGDEYPAPLSEIEEVLAKKYDVRWPNGIDWFEDAEIELILDHIVHVSTKYQVTWGPQPFDQIIERLGGYGLITGEGIGDTFGQIWVLLSCIAPDEATAIEIEKSKTPLWEDDKPVQTLRRYDTQLFFNWEWYLAVWKLEKLITELKELGCTNLKYNFSGYTHITTTDYHVPSEPSD